MFGFDLRQAQVRYKRKAEPAFDPGRRIDNDLRATLRNVRHKALAVRFLTIDRDPRRLTVTPPADFAL